MTKRIAAVLLVTAMLVTISSVAFAETNESQGLVVVFEDEFTDGANLSPRAIDIRDATVQIRIFVDDRNANNSTHSLFARCSIIGYGTTEVKAEVSVYKGSSQVKSTETGSGEEQTVAQFRLDSGTAGYEANATYTCVVNTRITKNGVTQTDTYTRNIVLDTSSATRRLPSNYGQSKTLWCWAASAICVAENNFNTIVPKDETVMTDQGGIRYTLAGYSNGSYTTPYSQSYVVKRVKNGSDANDSGNDADREAALRYALGSGHTANIGTVGTPGTTITSSSETMTFIKSELAAGRYVIANYHFAGDDEGGHSIVIKDYDASSNKFRVYDPWNEEDKWLTYNGVFGNYVSDAGSGKVTWIQYCN